MVIKLLGFYAIVTILAGLILFIGLVFFSIKDCVELLIINNKRFNKIIIRELIKDIIILFILGLLFWLFLSLLI